VRSMLMRVRSQEKCDDTSALTSNLLVSLVLSPGIELTLADRNITSLLRPGADAPLA
jgi:hypothetical protein